MQMVYRN